MTHYTYMHATKDGRVFYVGKGSGRRAWAKGKRPAEWRRVVAEGGLVVTTCPWPTEEDAYSHERLLIACLRDVGAPLINEADGGPGAPGRRLQADSIERIRASNLGQRRAPQTIKKLRAIAADLREARIAQWTPELRAEWSARFSGERHPNFGKKFSPELRAKLSAAHAGRPSKGKAVRCIETGAVFRSCAEAAESIGKPRSASPYIGSAARGKLPGAYGFTWEFV